ncbi:MAG TPA: pyridoxal phosphate-dependent aminotransferase [Thermoanaerobaculia bacterium]|nr:pyridoxal phosphate-dependent aminotransferase [Thermoanaerobaculia bacterium]
MFSRRAHWSAPPNRLAVARAQHRGPLLDLTNSNPTRAGLDYPLDELSEAMAKAARAPYEPEPLGLPVAREAIAHHLGCDARDVVVTASTSESYSFLFKLLCDPGDAIATPIPSYPLLEHLAALELVELRHFPLEFHKRWELEVPEGSAARAIVVVNPNNPTGSYVTAPEQDALLRLGVPIISDEVFHEYPFGEPAPSFGTFTLGGLSKSCGLPHYKLGWIRVRERDAVAALELIADNFLSVATPVQAALPDLLCIGARIRESIRARIRSSLAALETALADKPSVQLLKPEGGWTAVVRVPATTTDEDFALNALERHGVLVQPGYFFDFDRDGYFVVSLLTDPEVLQEGIARIV